MRSPSRRAARPFLALAAAGLATATLSTSPALAQDSRDPFALPATATADSISSMETGPLMSEIVIDGRARSRMVELSGQGDAVTIDAADARAAGLPVAEGASGPVRLSSLRLYNWKFDSFRQRLTVSLFRDNDGPNLRDLSARNIGPSESTPLTALRLDYDVTSTVSSRGATFGGFFDAAVVRGNAAFSSNARVLGTTDSKLTATRLNTTFELALPSRGLAAAAGDVISAGSQSQRPVRLGGIQLGNDFNLRPDLVSLPLPAFSGSVAVPTTIDLVGADRRQSVGKIEPGDFTVRNIPVPIGRGQITAVLRDALGRETIQTARFYISRDLLAKGRSAYAVNAGFVRRRFGESSSDYGPAAASAFVRRGLSDDLTVETSAEWTPGLVNFGARGDLVIAKLAKATVEARYSRDSVLGGGHLLNLALESLGSDFGAVIGATLPSATYQDVAGKLGDPAPPRRLLVNVFCRPFKDFRLQAGVVRTNERADPRFARAARRTDSAIASLQMPLSKRVRLVVAGDYRRFNGISEKSVSAGIAVTLGQRHRFAAQGKYGSNDRAAELYYARDENEPGDIGYSVSARHEDGEQLFTGRAAWNGPMMQVTGQAEVLGGDPAARVTARGSLLMARGKVYVRNQTETGFALVEANGVEGVPITMENRFVGKTNAKGRLLIDQVSSRIPVRIDVDPKQLPADALVRETQHVIRVPQRAVALVRLDALYFRPVMRTLVDAGGAPLAAGLRVRAEPSGERTLTGYDGIVEINAGAGDERLIVGNPGSACAVDLASLNENAEAFGQLTCRPVTIADAGEDASEAPPRISQSKSGRKRPRELAARTD